MFTVVNDHELLKGDKTMALTWKWDSKMGEAIIHDESQDKDFVKNLYEGNAFLIFMSEWTEGDQDWYNVYSFFADENHAKNCLGLTKNFKNIFEDAGIRLKKLRINKKKSRNWKKIVKLFSEAFDNIEIELYSEE